MEVGGLGCASYDMMSVVMRNVGEEIVEWDFAVEEVVEVG